MLCVVLICYENCIKTLSDNQITMASSFIDIMLRLFRCLCIKVKCNYLYAFSRKHVVIYCREFDRRRKNIMSIQPMHTAICNDVGNRKASEVYWPTTTSWLSTQAMKNMHEGYARHSRENREQRAPSYFQQLLINVKC